MVPIEDAELFAFNQDRLNEILFPVELRPVHVSIPEKKSGELFGTDVLRPAERFHAVVDMERGHTFAVVSDDYDFVHNEEAIELAGECFKTVFKITDIGRMRLFNIIMPATRSFCNVDFIHHKATFDFAANDPWSPFLRVTNSYNKTKALKFDLGFCRGICRNGLIFGKKNIEFKFTHSKSAGRDPQAEFRLRSGEFADLEAQFVEQLHNLQRFYVPREFMWAMLCKVFSMKIPPPDASTRQQKNWHARQDTVKVLTGKYFPSLGENGYAALNVLTDFATHPPKEGFGESRIHGLQTYTGLWAKEFVEQMKSDTFAFETYLGDYLQLAA